jgi:lysozyme
MVDLRTLAEAYTKANEGCRLEAYQDTRGIWTIGYGETDPTIVQGVVWTQAQADARFDARWSEANGDAENCVSPVCWNAMGIARQAVLADMAFQLGFRGLREFQSMRRALEEQRWADAAEDALESLAAKQAPNRWVRHARILTEGDAAIVNGALPTS